MPTAEPLFIRSRLLAAHGFLGIFSLRKGGFSSPPFDSLNLANDTGDKPDVVEKNLQILIQSAGLNCPPHRTEQVHGHEILTCHGNGRMHRKPADILFSEDGAPVAVRIADCTPVLIADPVNGRCVAVHAGWRGTAQSVTRRAVTALTSAGGDADSFIACIGPCIGVCCFEIGPEAANALRTCCTDAADHLEYRDSKSFADLAALNFIQLRDSGLRNEHIENMAWQRYTCTCCQPEIFFSYRRDGQRSGRHLAIVAKQMPA